MFLQGIAIGNGYVSEALDIDTAVKFAYAHGLIDDKVWSMIEEQCCKGCVETCDLTRLTYKFCSATVGNCVASNESLLSNNSIILIINWEQSVLSFLFQSLSYSVLEDVQNNLAYHRIAAVGQFYASLFHEFVLGLKQQSFQSKVTVCRWRKYFNFCGPEDWIRTIYIVTVIVIRSKTVSATTHCNEASHLKCSNHERCAHLWRKKPPAIWQYIPK